ncbi:MAG: hypothetical protein AAGE65_11620 [Planctomycetota bacterium]
MRHPAVLAAALGVAAATPTQAAPAFTVRDITPDGYATGTAYDVNASGDAVGVAENGPAGKVFFFYDHSEGTSTVIGAGTVVPRGTIVGTGFRGAAINDDGLIAGTARFLGGATESRGFVYSGGTAGAFTSLGTLPGATPSGIRPASDAVDLNATGFITGTATSGAGTTPQEADNIDVYLNTAAPLTDLDGDTTVATRGDFGRAVNDAGLVGGQSSAAKAALFSGATITLPLAGTAHDADASVVFDLNDNGDVLIENLTDTDALLYDSDAGTVTAIPQIGTGNRMFPKALNAGGDAVGQGDRTTGTSGQARGWLYDASESTSYILEDQTTLAGTGDDTLGDWEELNTAWGINASGWIVGQGKRRFTGNAFPNNRAYLLIPETITPPQTGDYNDSGLVEQGDLNLVLNNWGSDTTIDGVPDGWVNDLPAGIVDQAELNKVLNNWGAGSGSLVSGRTVPEPVGVAAAAFALAGCGRRGRSELPN